MNFTNQELFDKAYKAIIAQGVSSLRGNGMGSTCAYRGNDGTSCAIGHLLSLNLRETIEEGGIMTRLIDSSAVRDFFGISLEGLAYTERDSPAQEQAHFLAQLQRAHDAAALERGHINADFLPNFQTNMRQLAAEYNLTIPEA